MSEFKIDKLGWYESNTGEKIKIIHELKDKIFIGTSKSNYDSFTFDEDGEQTGYNEEEYKLIKYLGPEFPKEPRIFTSEIITNKSSFNIRLDMSDGGNIFYCDNMSFTTYEPKTKWEITVKEILK